MDNVILALGKNGLVGVIGLAFFILIFRYANTLFDWIEKQTIGTRTFVMEKLEFLFIEIKEDHVTYALLFFSFGLGCFFLLLIGLIGSWVVGSIFASLFFIFGWKIPKPFLNFLVERRIKAYQNQMVDGLTLLGNGIRAGLSVNQSLGMVVDEMPNPLAQEFNLILQQNKIGLPLEECFMALAKRVPLQDNDMFVSSVTILKETGGNLSEVFDSIVGVIRERVRLQQKVDTYTAQGMFQGMTIAGMPFAIAGIYTASDPGSMVPLVTTPMGLVMLSAALILDLIGFIIILKIVKIKM
jgi:tight adherence protein B